MSTLSTLPITLDGDSVELKLEEIRAYFHNTYSLYEKLFEMLKSDEVFYKKSEITRHPMIFYFGHTATFFINKLILAGVITKRVNPHFESIFAIGVDEMSWDDLNEANYNWPSVDEVREYRRVVRELVDELITSLTLSLPIKQDSAFWVILMGIEHERIHIETSSVLHRQLHIEDILHVEEFTTCKERPEAIENELVQIEALHVELGKSIEHNLYGWDNEYGLHVEDVSAFKTSKYLVSNAEFKEFVDDSGYESEEFWDEEGLKFLETTAATHPPFWVKQGNGAFKYRAITEVIEMPQSWPVDVNCLEAEAFCRWKSKKEGLNFRLPSEAEWMVLYEQSGFSDVPNFDKANINLAHFTSSVPVQSFLQGEVYDVVGNVWQWSCEAIDAYEGFSVHPIYDDFSTPTFDGKHNLMKGGSFISSGNELMKHSRYAFRKHFYQHAGFRYVQAPRIDKIEPKIYDSDKDIQDAINKEYEDCAEVLEYASVVINFSNNFGSALELGCSVGRVSFELSKKFEKVVGIESTARFIQVADSKNSAKNLEFWQGDFMNLKPHFRGYDLILLTNILEKISNPRLFLQEIKSRVNQDGILTISSTYNIKTITEILEIDYTLLYCEKEFSVWRLKA
ncbi:MAG: 5-histidylcysteine sulfoxide synthase [Campylobacterota bacterium]|nr:5-histidylcysteine sulfoxide synthase [Campylobacterota bacterium]